MAIFGSLEIGGWGAEGRVESGGFWGWIGEYDDRVEECGFVESYGVQPGLVA